MTQNNFVLYDVESTQEKGKIYIVQNMTAEIFLLAGTLGIMFCFLSDNTARIILTVTALISVAYLYVIGRWSKKMDILRIVPAAVGVIVVLLNPIGASNGFLYLCNQWISLWDRKFNQLIPQLQTTNVTVAARTQIFIFLVTVSAVWIHKQVKDRHLFRISCFVVLSVFITALFQIDISILWICCMTVGWLFCWLTSASIQTKLGKLMIAVTPGLAAMVCFGIAFYGYTGNHVVEDLKEELKSGVEKLRYGEDTLPAGNMTQAYNMTGSEDEETLRITVDKANEMYLRGFVGGDFDGDKWKELSYEDYTNEELSMCRWLEDQGFVSGFQYRNYLAYTGEAQNDETSHVTVENVGADRRYVYLPYEVDQVQSGQASSNRDYQMKSKGFLGARSYSFDEYSVIQPAETLVQNELDHTIQGAEEYDQKEKIYLTYVYDNYLNITDEQKEKIQQLFFSEGDWSNASLYQVTEQIRIILQQLTTYTDTPEKFNGGADFLSWFLEDKKTGNSAYYATVGVMAYRAAGIPARYVEGYHLSASDTEGYEDAGQAEISLSQANAHSWTEVYMDGIGWLPVEIVPGFYFAEYTTQQVVGSPETSVNIVNQTDEEQLEGSTADSLDPIEDEKKDEPSVPEKIIRILGIVMLILITLWLLQFVIILRYRIVNLQYEKKLERAGSGEASRIRYHHVNRVLKEAGIGAKEDYPYDNIPMILEKYPKMEEFECTRFIQLLQKVVFGQQELSKAEYTTILVYDQKITENVYKSLSSSRKLVMKYLKVLV
ncbi:MAG: transglutaminase domain-containing protein [Clostridia bacterium]|nr:transglutaminase domain-containing protein [Clostridia bacterium]NCC43792.1 transglutaminase domain-containing protein [Clostridia bacterium]